MESPNTGNNNLFIDRIEKFHDLGKRFFEISEEGKASFFDTIHEKLNYKFPPKDSKYNDYILPFKAIPLSLIYDTSFLKEYEDWLKNESGINPASLNVYNLAKDYYYKWAIAKDYSERIKNKELLNDISNKNFDERIFFICIFEALISLSENKSTPDIPNLLLKVQRIIEPLKLSKGLRNRINYILQIIFGIYYFKSKDFAYSKVKITEALSFHESGITAKYYLAYIDTKLSDFDSSFNYIKDIFYFDAERIVKSIGYKDLNQFIFYVKNAEFYYLLADNEFYELADTFENFFNEIDEKIKISDNKLIGALDKIKKMELEEFYDDDIKKYFTFLESVLAHFINKNNFFFKMSIQYLQKMLNECINQLIINVSNNYNEVVEKKLEIYDFDMADNYEEIIRLQKNLEKEKIRKDEIVESSIINLEKEINKTVEDCKTRLVNIGNDEKYNFKKVFSNAMLYNTIISFVIIIIGGFVKLTKNPEVEESKQLVDITQNAIKSGFQWGGAIFFFGCIIACVMVFITILKKNSMKNQLINTIRNQSQNKAEGIENIRSKKDKELESLIIKTNIKIEKLKQIIDSLKAEKEQEEKILKESADTTIEEYQYQLKEILSM